MATIPDITLEQKFEAIYICHNTAVCMKYEQMCILGEF